MRPVWITALSFALAGCASLDGAACAGGETATISETLYFGMAKPTGGTVSSEEWAGFLRDVVTPRFPAGLTAWPASGQWRGADGEVVREDSHVLTLLHPQDAASENSVLAIVADYKTRFEQEAVLRVRSRVCTSL
jgi:hypothetical protein